MAYTDFAAYKAQYKTPNAELNWWHANPGLDSSNYPLMSTFVKGTDDQNPMPQGGTVSLTIPSTAAACDNTTAGAIIHPKAGSGDQVLVSAYIQPRSSSYQGMLLVDRLSHQGGLAGNITTLQNATNLPTAALTRYTSGVGVYAALEVYTALGNTDAVWTVVYTNQAGTGSRSVSFILPNTPVIDTFIPIPLQGSDTGVKSVESVQLGTSTGSAGNFGITLFKPLIWLCGAAGALARPLDIFEMPGWNTPILDDACLQVLQKFGSTGSIQVMAQLQFGES